MKPTNYLMRDTGKPGRTPESKKLPFRLRPGKLRGWRKDEDPSTRRRILEGIVRREGYATATRRLVALKNISPDAGTDRAVNADLNWLRENYVEE